MEIAGISPGLGAVEAGDKKSGAQADGGFAELLAKESKPKGLTAEEKFAAAKARNEGTMGEFLDYMKKTPAERMEEAWLKAHGLTKADLEKKSPEEQKAIRDAMKKDIEDQLKREAEQKAKEARPQLAV